MILIVDDQEIIRLGFTMELEALGFKANTVNSGQEALSEISKNHYSLIFMDVEMPGMNGFETTNAIREAERETGTHIPIVGFTASSNMEQCLAAGMDDYLNKSADKSDIKRFIER